MLGFSRRKFLGVSLGCTASAITARALSDTPLREVSHRGHALGSQVTLTVLATNNRQAEAAIADALSEIDAVEDALSLYRPASDLCRLNRSGLLLEPDQRLVEVLRYASGVSDASAGAFDVTVQPLWEVYDQAARVGKLPQPTDVAATRVIIDWRQIEVTESEIRLHDRRARITLNGIAQGYAADRAREVLHQHGIQHALIHTGELATQGRHRASRWRVGIQHPRAADAFVALVELENRALATTGDYASTFTADRSANHVLDPKTGESPTELASVSIAAPTAMEADALSTACFVLGVDEAIKMLRFRTGCDALFVTKQGRMIATLGFPQVKDEVHLG